ncbi:hypothetical protein ACWKWU_03345 [Chitinophaga lutea]
MHNLFRHITLAGRLRIFILLVLSLVSAMPDVTPDGTGGLMARIPEAIHHENEIPEACKVSLRLEAATIQQQLRHQLPGAATTASPGITANGQRRTAAVTPRPSYYAHLHRYSLF